MSTEEFAVELGEGFKRGKAVNYGQIHAAGCKDLVDGEAVGANLLSAHEELWPESGPFESIEDALKACAPCAKALYKKLEASA